MMKRMLGTIVSLFITMFFMGIILYVMMEGMHLPDKETWAGIITFTIIEFIILLGVIGLGKLISRVVGTGLYAAICAMTVFYTILCTALNLILSGGSAFVIILVNLILLFIYAAVVLPLAVKGIGSRDGDFPKDPTNPNNLPTSPLLNKGVNNNAQAKSAAPAVATAAQTAQIQSSAPSFCPDCGRQIAAGEKFCTGCGKKFSV